MLVLYMDCTTFLWASLSSAADHRSLAGAPKSYMAPSHTAVLTTTLDGIILPPVGSVPGCASVIGEPSAQQVPIQRRVAMGAGEQKSAFPPGDPSQILQIHCKQHAWAPRRGPAPGRGQIAGYPPAA